MADPVFRQRQFDGLRQPHIAPFTELVDDLVARGDRGWMPYIAPMYGGVNARVLSIFRDPGPKTQDGTGSGMLCCQNDDPSAELHATLLAEAGIPVAELLPWNSYPWYINRKPTGEAPSPPPGDSRHCPRPGSPRSTGPDATSPS